MTEPTWKPPVKGVDPPNPPKRAMTLQKNKTHGRLPLLTQVSFMHIWLFYRSPLHRASPQFYSLSPRGPNLT